MFGTLQAYLGGYYVNDFNLYGRVFRVFVQAEPDSRATPDDVTRPVRAQRERRDGAAVDDRDGAADRRAADDRALQPVPDGLGHGQAAPGRSSGQAIQDMEALADRVLPEGTSFEWTGLSLQELRAGGTAPVLFGLALVVVFLCLAALYESWLLPLTIMLVVPLAVLGALLAQAAARAARTTSSVRSGW